MRTSVKIALGITAGLIAIVLVGILVATWAIRRPFPKVRGRETVSGLSAPVEILRDDDGVPHIWASTSHDLYFAQGYVHAQDRFWQMEFWRRIGTGRLSEILGESALDQDRYLRTMGFARVAEREYELQPAETRAVLDAYAEGVNAYIMDRKPGKLGLEFALLKLTGVDIEIEPWTGVNSLTWGKIMALDLGFNMNNELGNLSLVRFGGTRLYNLVRTPYAGDLPYIVTLDEVTAARREAGLPPLPEPGEPVAHRYSSGQSGIGSNNWVIGPQRTATGAPILANDMHLSVQIPSIWYEVGLHLVPLPGSDEEPLNLRGFSFAGVPGIVAGQNDHVAWGMTNLGGDVQDLFLERINPENPDQYWDGANWQNMDVRLEMITVDGRDEPYVQRVRSTPRGPLLTDLPQLDKWFSYMTGPGLTFPGDTSIYELSLGWTALQPETLLSSVVALDRATSAAEVRQALSLWASPGQNIVYADADGTIGYQAVGSYPDRPPSAGRAPTPGWDSSPMESVKFDDFPFSVNPEKGYIVTANNPVVPPDYPYPLGVEFSNGLRAKRIAEMIEGFDTGIGTEEVRAIHADVWNRTADEVIPYLSGVDLSAAYNDWSNRMVSFGADADEIDARTEADLALLDSASAILFQWDRRQDEDSPGAAAWGFVWKRLLEETFSDEVPPEYWPFSSVTGLESAVPVLLDQPSHPVWDDRRTGAITETRDEILDRALVAGLLDAGEELGQKADRWTWGNVHRIEFRNATLGESGIGPIERLFNRGPFALPGGASTVNVAHWRLDEPFDVSSIASERAIYDLADPSGSMFIHPTGQSGHAFNRHYLDFFGQWHDVEYHPARWTREEVERSAGGRVLTLKPSAGDSAGPAR